MFASVKLHYRVSGRFLFRSNRRLFRTEGPAVRPAKGVALVYGAAVALDVIFIVGSAHRANSSARQGDDHATIPRTNLVAHNV